MFVALTQVDFMFIRIAADLIVNAHTTYYFLRGKIVNPALYNQWKDNQKEAQKSSWVAVDDNESELLETIHHSEMHHSEMHHSEILNLPHEDSTTQEQDLEKQHLQKSPQIIKNETH